MEKTGYVLHAPAHGSRVFPPYRAPIKSGSVSPSPAHPLRAPLSFVRILMRLNPASPMVSINPESKSRQTNRDVLNELIELHGNTSLGGKLPAYDGRKSLYTAGSLPFESEEFTVTLVDPERKDQESDGVSEGQFSHAHLHETDAIGKKRLDTRLLHEVHGRRDMTDKSANIIPGTTVGQKICHPTDFIWIEFYILGMKANVIVRRFSSIDFIVEIAMGILNVRLTDVFVLRDGRTVEGTTLISDSCRLLARHGVRGGVSNRNSPIQFIDLIQLIRKTDWFEKIDIPIYLDPKQQGTYVIALGDVARHIFSMLGKALRRVHSDNRTFKGGFGIGDICYVPITMRL